MHSYESIGFIASIFTLLTLAPHLLTMIKSGAGRTMPNSTIVFFVLASLSWIIYGVGASSPSLVMINLLLFAAACTLFAQHKKTLK